MGYGLQVPVIFYVVLVGSHYPFFQQAHGETFNQKESILFWQVTRIACCVRTFILVHWILEFLATLAGTTKKLVSKLHCLITHQKCIDSNDLELEREVLEIYVTMALTRSYANHQAINHAYIYRLYRHTVKADLQSGYMLSLPNTFVFAIHVSLYSRCASSSSKRNQVKLLTFREERKTKNCLKQSCM